MVFTIKCNHKPTEALFSIEGILFYASNQNNIGVFDGDLIINLTKIPDTPKSASIPELKDHYYSFPEEIMIPCPDYGTPNIKLSFWEALFDYIKKEKFETVCIHCELGHGRTGTALSSIIIANLGLPADEAVDIVRRKYCEDAVETFEQAEYLQEIDEFYNKREISYETMPLPSMEGSSFHNYNMGA